MYIRRARAFPTYSSRIGSHPSPSLVNTRVGAVFSLQGFFVNKTSPYQALSRAHGSPVEFTTREYSYMYEVSIYTGPENRK